MRERRSIISNSIYMFSVFFLLHLIKNVDSTIKAVVDEKNKLDDFIQHYEVLDYEPVDRSSTFNARSNHSRIKRWLLHDDKSSDWNEDDEDIQVKFCSHGRNFHLRLKRDTTVFSEEIQVITGDKSEPLVEHNLVEGYLEDEEVSKVFGSILDGIFHGHIFTPSEGYSVERTSRFEATNPNLRNSSQHSVIYSHNNIQKDAIKGSGHLNGCGVTDQVQEWMTSLQNSRIVEDEFLQQTHYIGNKHLSTYNSNHSILLQDLLHNEFPHGIGTRVKRNIRNGLPSSSASVTAAAESMLNTTCRLYIRTDPMLWRQIEIQEGTKNPEKIREIILGIVGEHVKASNEIFQATKFEDNGHDFRNMKFEVRIVKIDSYDDCRPGYKGPSNPFCEEHIDVSNFLDMHSRGNYNRFCLSYMFTYRDFLGGVVGLAWVASTSSGGGICQKHSKYLEGFSMKERSLNSGIVTFLNYNRQLPPRLSHLTMAHEIGHNFGAPHDPDECQPGSLVGNYLMYASSTNGYLINNDQFSKCSIRSIVPVLNQIYHTTEKENCFTESHGAFCGNRIVEESEECDCGFGEECTEKCCYPTTSSPGSSSRNSCKRTPQALCSYSEGPCCNPDTCGFVPQYEKSECQKENECMANAFCNGTSARCPIPRAKPNNTICNNGTQVCLGGECRGSICLNFGLTECYLSSSDYSDKRALCNVSCADATGMCRSTYDLDMPGITRTLSLRPGSPCDNFRGYCDVFMKCRAVNEEGPLLRLKRWIFREYGFRTLHQWVNHYWWAVFLMGIGFIILMALVIQCCAVHTPSSNPYMSKNVKIGETMRHPMDSLKRRHKKRKPDINSDDYTLRETMPLRTLR